MNLKETIKSYAYNQLGADLVGCGDIARCRHAPPMMSPQGLMPKARTVLVMALRHPDACITLGGEEHSQIIGPYSVQYLMNARLDTMSYRMARFLEQHGCNAIPIVSSNIWRYNQYKDLSAIFAPDLSHIYMAVVAGLADMGYSGLALTPEFGARNRFITVITDAELEADPLIKPGSVCDQCMLCRKHCPASAFDREVKGEKVLRIDPYEYRFANKNLWRCAWGEHFDLDLDLPIPEVVDEKVIVEQVNEHGIRSGEMGQCLKFCLPKSVRTWNPVFSRAPIRHSAVHLDEKIESRGLTERMIAQAYDNGADQVIVQSGPELAKQGIDIERQLPGAKSVITVVASQLRPALDKVADESERIFRLGPGWLVDSICYDLARQTEDYGFQSVMTLKNGGSKADGKDCENITGQIMQLFPALTSGRYYHANSVVTTRQLKGQVKKRLTNNQLRLDRGQRKPNLTLSLLEYARQQGADLAGVAPVYRLNRIADQIGPYFEGKQRLTATDHSHRFKPWEPEIARENCELRVPEDYLAGAKSVIVLAIRYPREVLDRVTQPPAEAVGPYAFLTYITEKIGAITGGRLIKRLEDLGHRGNMTMDLMNTGGRIANPRGRLPDLCSNRFAAVAAGLGETIVNGHVATPEFGIRQRFIAVVTDAELIPSAMISKTEAEKKLCETCDQPCIKTCPSQAISQKQLKFSCEGKDFSFNLLDHQLCDWSKRYALLGDSGFKYLGSTTNIEPGNELNQEKLAEALKQHDPIKKYRPVVAEPCVINCPYAVD